MAMLQWKQFTVLQIQRHEALYAVLVMLAQRQDRLITAGALAAWQEAVLMANQVTPARMRPPLLQGNQPRMMMRDIAP